MTPGSRSLVAGVVAVIAYNAWKWRQDRLVADRLRTELAQPRPALSSTPKVSILVAAWNESQLLRRHVESILALKYPNIEYVLCAGGTDATYEIAQACAGPGTILLKQHTGEGKQSALRRAFAASSGEIVFLSDADCFLENESFERTIEPIVLGHEVVTSGDSMPLREQLTSGVFSSYQWAAQAYAAAHSGRYVDSLLGRNAAVRRSVLVKVGAFYEDVATGTDYHLGKSIRHAGYDIRHISHSLVRTEYPASLTDYIRQQRRWLRNVVLLGTQSGSWHEVRLALQTSAVGAVMLLAPLAALALGQAVLAGWSVAFVHSVAAKIRYAAFAERITGTRASRVALLAPVFTLVDFGVWALPLLDYPFATRRWVW